MQGLVSINKRKVNANCLYPTRIQDWCMAVDVEKTRRKNAYLEKARLFMQLGCIR